MRLSSGLVTRSAVAVLLCACFALFSFLSSGVHENRRTELQQLVVTTGDPSDTGLLDENGQALARDGYDDFAMSSLKDGLGSSQSDDFSGRYGTRNVNINIIKGGGAPQQPPLYSRPPASRGAVSSVSNGALDNSVTDNLRQRIRANTNAIRGLQNAVASSSDKMQFTVDGHTSSIAALRASNALLKAQLRKALANEAVDAKDISNLRDQEKSDVSRLNRMVVSLQKFKAIPGPAGPKGSPGRPGAVGPAGKRGRAGKDGLPGKNGARGAPGPRGPGGGRDGKNGLPGRDGLNGRPGQPGPRGYKGNDGARGPRGRPGPQGNDGREGKPGPRGAVGAPGFNGAPGKQGSRGFTGALGSPGPRGFIGPRGYTGAPGRAGAKGEPGPRGPRGFKGDKGDRGNKGIDGGRGYPGLKGAQGNPGPAGAVGKRGPVGPRGFIGPRGNSGANGHDGARGRPGPPGVRGAPGPASQVAGPRGLPGPAGGLGKQGATGPRGFQGAPGTPGRNGVNGAPGAIGRRGPVGFRGPPGVGRSGAPGKGDQGASISASQLSEFYGQLAGVIRRASDANFVGGATVRLMADKKVLRTVKSQANGRFTISAPGGEYILSITNIPTMNGVEFTEPVRILNSRTVTRTYAVSSPVQRGQLRIVLTWGATPRDMDSHLDTPSGCHVYYGRKQCPSGEAALDTDVTDSYGPETINIRSLKPGVYKYKVHAYSSGAIEDSGASVSVYGVGKKPIEFVINKDGEVRKGNWYVFNLKVDKQGRVTVADPST